MYIYAEREAWKKRALLATGLAGDGRWKFGVVFVADVGGNENSRLVDLLAEVE